MSDKNNTIPLAKSHTNLVHQQFNRWTVLSYNFSSPRYSYQWFCQCKCGTIKSIDERSLKTGNSKSCGCLRKERSSEIITHGEKRGGRSTPEYRAFYQAKTRCNNPNYVEFELYGGRGIEFRFDSFEEFLAEVGRKPTPQHSLDRINPSSHYEKGNVQWASNKQQQRNKRNNLLVTWEGKTQTAIDWAEEKGINCFALYSRLKRGWCISCALTQSSKPMNCPHK